MSTEIMRVKLNNQTARHLRMISAETGASPGKVIEYLLAIAASQDRTQLRGYLEFTAESTRRTLASPPLDIQI